MNPRLRLNLLLLTAVVILGAVALWAPAPSDRQQSPPPRLTPMDSEAVRHIVIRRPGLEGELRLDKGDDRWQVTLPGREPPLPANDFKAEQIARIAEAEVYDRFPAEEDKLAEYGLDQPRAWLRLNAVELSFGASEPLRQRRYVRLGDWIHLIDGYHLDDVAVRPADLLERALLPGQPALQAIRLPEFAVTQDENGDWRLQPPREGLTADALQSFVDAWRHARAMELHLSDPPTDTQGEVILTTTDGQDHRFLITQRGERKRLRLWDPQRRVEYEFAVYNSERLLDPERHLPEEEDEPAAERGDDSEADG